MKVALELVMGKDWKNFKVHGKKKNQNVKKLLAEICMLKATLEVSEGTEERFIGNRRKGNPYYKGQQISLNCSSVL